MKIERIEAIPFAIPYAKRLQFASGEVDTARHVLVRVHTTDGLIGTAEAPPRPFTYGETQASIIAVINDVFAPQITGLTIFQRERVRALLDRTIGNPTAKAAVDMALWDLIGQSLGASVTDLLGGFGEGMRVCHMLGFDTPEVMVEQAHRMRENYGISTFKVKVGRHPVDLDVAVCRALRAEFGDAIELYIDGNRGWSASESAEALRQMADLGLTLAEELCPADDVLGRRWLVRQAPIPFVADESAQIRAA